MVWALHWDISRDALSFPYSGLSCDDDAPRPYHLALLKAYNEVEPDMLERMILPDEAGVLYQIAIAKRALGIRRFERTDSRCGFDAGCLKR